jgi:hypothetical protein
VNALGTVVSTAEITEERLETRPLLNTPAHARYRSGRDNAADSANRETREPPKSVSIRAFAMRFAERRIVCGSLCHWPASWLPK